MPDFMGLAKNLLKPLSRWFLRNDEFYATGSYLPTMVGGTTTGTTAYSVQAGEYTRFGRVVHAQGRVSWTNATGTGVPRISLPFTSTSTTNIFGAASIATDSVTFAGAAPQGLVRPGTAYVELSYPVSNGPAVDMAVEATGSVFFSVVYIRSDP